jgi:phosphatidylglycerol lysyltransferase
MATTGSAAGAKPLLEAGRPPAPSGEAVIPDRARAEAVVLRYGRAPLDYFKLWPDKSYFFSASIGSVIAYRTAWSVAVSLGDPVGPAEELPGVVESFARFCAQHGWHAAFHQAGPDLVPTYRHHGFHVLKIGEEAMVDLECFASRTSRQRRFSHPRRRLAADGYRVSRQQPPHPADLLDEAEEVSREWLSLPRRRERSFALGQFDRDYLAQRPLVLARDPSGRLVGFLNEIPGVRPGVATVDLMRHRRDAPNGLMDYLFSEVMLRAHQDGYRWFSLGLAPLAGVGDGAGAGLPERVVHELFEHASAVFSFKGLRAYKAKFDPVWEERYLAYQGGPFGLVRTAAALASLTLG